MASEDKLKKLQEILELQYEKATRNFSFFFQWGWPVLEPNNRLLWNWSKDLIAEYLTAVKLKQLKRLIINEPPRELKSLQVSVAFPAWVWTDKPSERFMGASYSQSLATKHSVDRRSLITSEWYQMGWSHKFKLSADQDTKMEFSNNKRGHMIATSMGGTATGKGCNILIVDDPHDTTIAESEVQRKTTIDEFDQKLTTRLDNPKDDAIIVVMQRLHQNDLTGHLKEQGGYEHLVIPAVAPEPKTYVYPRTGRIYHRKEGELLDERRMDATVIAQKRIQLGSQGFAGQMQQEPTDPAGAIIKRAWMRYYREPPGKFDEVIQSWDCAFKDLKESDFVVGQVWGRVQALYYLIHEVRAQLDFNRTLDAVAALSAQFPLSHAKYVEDKANGPAVISVMQTKISGLIPVLPEGPKESRLISIQPTWEAGNIILPDPSIAPWIGDYVDEIVGFPNMKKDDRVDATTQAIIKLRGSGISTFTKDYIPNKIGSITAQIRGRDSW